MAAGLNPFISFPTDQSPPLLERSNSAVTCETLACDASALPGFFPFLTLLLLPSPFSSLFLSLNKDVMPARELRRASLPMEPSLRIITDAEETVEEREMLSVDMFIRALKSAAARDFFFGGGVVVTFSAWLESLPPLGLLVDPDVTGLFGPDEPALIDASSSSLSPSSNDCAALKARALRSRPLSPPLRSIDAVGSGSRMAARSLSSRDTRFSAAVKLPWDNGERLAGLETGRPAADTGDTEGAVEDGRIETDELDDEEEWVRLCLEVDEDALEGPAEEEELPVLPWAPLLWVTEMAGGGLGRPRGEAVE